jgi:biopolymer transport protein ExbD
MIQRQQNERMTGGRLRTRYFPRSRIGQGAIAVAPWANLLLLMLMFFLMSDKIVVQPGITIDVPAAPLSEGTPFGLVAVVLSVDAREEDSGGEIVFFDDERFRVADAARMRDLRNAFAKRVRDRAGETLVVHADRQVRHGTVVAIVNMAREAGLRRINVAERTP